MGKCIVEMDDPISVKTEELDKHLPKFQPLMPVHFEELNCLWPADRRIPSISSRRDWALARGLNPVNVHSWWYRRRKLAKKLKISIPREPYELDVGTPPIFINEVEEDVRSSTVPGDTDADGDCVPSSDTLAHIPSSENLSSPTEDSDVTLKSFTENCGNKLLGTMAYPVSPSPELLDQSRCSSRSPSPPLLFFLDTNDPQHNDEEIVIHETPFNDVRAERDALWALFSILDSFYPKHVLPTNVSGTPLSSCASKALWRMSGLLSEPLAHLKSLSPYDARYTIDLPPQEAPWCIDGFRIHYDGSVLGLCSCFNPRAQAPCSTLDDDIELSS